MKHLIEYVLLILVQPEKKNILVHKAKHWSREKRSKSLFRKAFTFDLPVKPTSYWTKHWGRGNTFKTCFEKDFLVQSELSFAIFFTHSDSAGIDDFSLTVLPAFVAQAWHQISGLQSFRF